MTTEATATGNKIEIVLLGQEGDPKEWSLNTHWHLKHVLGAGLKELYGPQAPDPDQYDIVLGGKILEPLSLTVSEAGITPGARVSILPKTVTRG